MSRMLLPDNRFQSPTAVQGKGDLRDENVYSAIAVGDAASGQQNLFTVPKGQAIPTLGAAATAAHQLRYTDTTTNLTKAGELGSAIGDASIYGIGLTLENAYYDANGALNSYGAGQREVAEILAKTFFILEVGGKKQIQGASFMFPSVGGLSGGISSTENSVTVATVNNGPMGSSRKLKLPIPISRTDTLVGTFGVAGGATLSFSSSPQAVLVWATLSAGVRSDAR